MSKIFERFLSSQLISYIEKHSIISSHQFGFQKGKSTSCAITSLLDYIYNCLDKKHYNISLFIDLSKAFDTVDHQILLQKLYMYGIRGLPLSLFRSYLLNRQQRVRIGKSFSDYKTINIGVPQGSVLGPIFFILYINDLPNLTNKSFPVLYADDTTISMSGSDYDILVGDMDDEVDLIKKWMETNKLSLNISKTFSISFSTRKYVQPINTVYLNNVPVKRCDNEVFLGIVLDDRLNFSLHIGVISRKISRSAGILYKLRDVVPNTVLLSLYYSLVYPYLIYCVTAWGGTNDCYTCALFIQQKRIVRIITGSDYLSHTDLLFKQLSILKLHDIYNYFLCLHMFKLKNSNSLSTINHSYITRNRNEPLPSFHRLTLTQQSINFSAPHAWNEFPDYLKNVNNLSRFKSLLKLHFINLY